MCGIIGMYSRFKGGSVNDIHLLLKLMNETAIRGLHSFGVAYYIGRDINVEKQFNLEPEKLLRNYTRQGGKRLIFHCRYSTSGDFKDMSNNQPTVCRNIAVVFNGIISMGRKSVFEEDFNVSCESENDAEIILRRKETPLDFLYNFPDVSFAGLFLKNKKLIALRNYKRPMYIFKRMESIFFISTRDIAIRAGVKGSKIEPVEPYKEMVI